MWSITHSCTCLTNLDAIWQFGIQEHIRARLRRQGQILSAKPPIETRNCFDKRLRAAYYQWSDDIEQWCGATLQELSHAALDRQRWAAIVTMVSDTNGR